MDKERCYGCMGATFGDCEKCQEADLIRREDVIEAINDSDIRGYKYVMLMRRIRELPRVMR